MGENEEFNTLAFEKRLTQLKETQESIQSMSAWCLKQRLHHKKIVSSWLNVLKRVKIEQRLVLFYLANDVIQYSKRKNYEFVESWGLNLQKATPLVRDEKVRTKILRIFKIWEVRSVYDDEFLSDLTGLLSAGAIKKTDDDPLDFQPQQLVNKIKQCSVLEADTQIKLKNIHDNHLELSDADALCANLKDRSHKDDVEKELSEGIVCVEKYTQALQREIVAREALLALLTSANQYYSTQRGEVKVVAYAYKNFGARVKALKRKLDELIPTLPSAAPSPPQRDEDVPSPGPDEDLELPAPESGEEVQYNIDRTFNTSLSADGSLYNFGLSSFLTSDNPMALFNETSEIDISAKRIQVINTRPSGKQDIDLSDILDNYDPLDSSSVSSEHNSGGSANILQIHEALPGLDLLTPESTGNPPPPTSFYGTMETITIPDDQEQPYMSEVLANRQWSNAAWTIPPPSTARSIYTEPPASPPPHRGPPALPAPLALPMPLANLAPLVPPALPPLDRPTERLSDVDHRGVLPPPPPPPVMAMLSHMEDVDHRLLPNVSQLPPPVTSLIRHSTHKDVDHRNLISLTHLAASQLVPQTAPRPHHPVDQDYRVPPLVPPSDIVESVDMDLSEDEEQHGMYPSQHQQNTNEHRRNSFNNNKVLVGGEVTPKIDKDMNYITTNNVRDEDTAPIIPPLSNPFDNMPSGLKFNMPFQNTQYKDNSFENDTANDSFDKDFRSNSMENMMKSPEYDDFSTDSEFHGPRFGIQRFPRSWRPMGNFRPFHPQFRPRAGPRPPNRWMGPRPQRFW